jgi:hypothetical protein
MAETIVDKLHLDFRDLVSILEEKAEISLRAAMEENVRKSLLLCAASYFEHAMTAQVEIFAHEISKNNLLLTAFIKNKAINRQYHTWFDWTGGNANAFFGLFGKDFATFMRTKVKNDRDLEASIKSFLELGAERNRLVHQDYGTFPLEKTVEEIYSLYCSAQKFVDLFPKLLRDCCMEIGTIA